MSIPTRVPSRIENRPYDQSTPILVIIRNLSDYKKIEEKRLDYGKKEDRAYLGKITFWAITNNHSIETMSLDAVTPPVESSK